MNIVNKLQFYGNVLLILNSVINFLFSLLIGPVFNFINRFDNFFVRTHNSA